MTATSPGANELLALIPIYNDWDAVTLLLADVDAVFVRAGLRGRVLLVDDGSTMAPSAALRSDVRQAITAVDVLPLRRNVGHQRAIAIGLAYASERLRPSAVLVMDGDGEDAPADIPRLVTRLAELGGQTVIFAERRKRSESLLFRLFYGLYRLAHRILTGIPVRVGNFSLLPAVQLQRLVVVSELWNHYAAAVFAARLPRAMIPTVRAHRLKGQSRMNFVALVAHGLSALSVHAEVIGVRLLVVALVGVAALVGTLAAVLFVRLMTPFAIPGWATAAGGLLLVLLSQAVAFAVIFVFLVLHGRSQPSFIPLRDYPYFVSEEPTATIGSNV